MSATTTKRRERPTPTPPNGKAVETLTLDSGSRSFINKVLIATPSRGTVRIEWHSAVRGMLIPPNWSATSMVQRVAEFYPIQFSVADAQNLIVREALGRDFEWVLLLEDDVLPPPDLLVRMRAYMQSEDMPPVISGLYFTKSNPSEPLVYRGRGNGPYLDWKLGQRVWADGVPTGCLIIHSRLLQLMWDDSEEYVIGGSGQATRRVFHSPTESWVSPEGDVNAIAGTSDLWWCDRVISGGYLKRAGFPTYARRKYPFLVDTQMLCGHVTPDGQMFKPEPAR